MQITIVNLLGNTVARLFDGELQAGDHSFVWDADHAPDGTYFCLVRDGTGADSVIRAALVVAH